MHTTFAIITLITLFIIGKLEARNNIYNNGPVSAEFFDNGNYFLENFNNSNSEVNDVEEDYRLPKTVIPNSYDLMIQLKKKQTFYGLTKINVTVKEKTDEIVLHHGNINLTEIMIKDLKSGKMIMIIDQNHNRVTEKLTIKLKDSLEKDSKVLLAIAYEGVARNDLIGFYISSYFDENDNIKSLAATQFQAVHARQVFPCFDEPSFKAKFTIRIGIPKGYNCLSNMPISKTSESNDKVKVIFKESMPMSTYLVAFVISQLESRSSGNFTVWSRKEIIDQGDYAIKIGKESLKLFEDTFNQKYQLDKMDMVAVPDFSAGAMENWGLITYRETAMLYNKDESSDIDQQNVAATIVHECAHMWFGNLVTPDWWGVLWLSEGFARYFQYMATAKIEPTWDMDLQFISAQHQVALSVDGLNSSAPLSRNVASQSEIGKSGDTITYNKGASVIRMMEKSFGSEIFNKALKNFLESRKYDNAVPENLWTELQKEIDLTDFKLKTSVETIMNSWTKQPGFPVVSVFIEDGKAFLTQNRFLLRNFDSVATNFTWWIPITWTVKSKPNFATTVTQQWIVDNSSVNVQMKKDDWIIFNVQSAGFYRVNYDKESWYRIIDTLNSKQNFAQIHELNRAAIVDDLMNLARADYLDYNVALDGLKYLIEETHYVPYKSALNALVYLTKRFSGQQEEDLYKDLILTLINKTYRKLTYDDKDGDNRIKILLRMELNDLACRFNHDRCIKKSLEYFERWKSGNLKTIPKNHKFTVFSTAMKKAPETDWDTLWSQHVRSKVPSEQIEILRALGCSENYTIVEKYLLRALSSYEENRIRKQDSNTVFNSVASCSPHGAKFIINFIDRHYKKIIEYNRGSVDSISTILSTASEYVSTQELVDDFEKLINSHRTEFKSIISTLESKLKLAKYELEWYKKHSKTIVNWINKFNEKEDTSATTDYFLPGDIVPSKYSIHVIPHFTEKNFTFDGTVEIETIVKDITNKIVLHAYQIKHKTVDVLANNVSMKVLDVNYSENSLNSYNFMTIFLDDDLFEGTQVTIKINYTGHLNTDLRGFYRSSYKDDKGQIQWLAATHLEPVGARRMFPCFDEPSMKAIFSISVTRPQHYHAISNMKLILMEHITDNIQKDTFAPTPKMSTYLVALIVSQFSYKKEDKYKVWTRPDAISQVQYAISLMSPFIKFYENALQHKYELSKLDMVALPDFPSGAMENWGLITFKEPKLLYDEDKSSLFHKQDVSNVIGHEFAHQWFGDLVTPLWWKYLWLNEGFARYLQYFASDSVEKSWRIPEQFVVDHLQTSFDVDGYIGSQAVTHDVYSPMQIRSRFNKISYAKAGSILRMTEKTIGSKLFYESLHNYLENRKYNTVTPDDLYEALQDKIDSVNLDLDIKTFLDSWTLKPGFPVVNIKIDHENVTFSQERFLSSNEEKYPINQTWWVPITWTTQNENNFNDTVPKYWLKDDKNEISIKKENEEWIIFNIQQTGYYRVNYDEENWKRIITALKSKDYTKIHEINRASLIDDLFNLGKTGYVSYDKVLSATQYLEQETNYLPWKAAFRGLSELQIRFMDEDIYDTYGTHVRTLLTPIFNKLGVSDIKDEDHYDKLLRILVVKWACDFKIPKCVNHAMENFAKFKNDSSFKVPANHRTTIFCTAIKHGTKDDFEFLKKKFFAANSEYEKMNLFQGLRCSENSEHLSSIFESAVTEVPKMKRKENFKIFSYMYKASSLGVEIVLDYLQNNYDNIYKYVEDEQTLKNILKGISKRISSKKLLNKSLAKMDKYSVMLNTSNGSYYSRIKEHLSWYEKYSPKIWEWLETTYPSSNYRLPVLMEPTLYDIHLKTYFEENNFTFEGEVKINVKIIQNTSRIILNANDLNFKEIRVFDQSGKEMIISSYTITSIEKLSIYLSSIVKADTILTIIFKYSGVLNEIMKGFYRSSYADDNNQTRWLATTNFQPTYARRAFPCFDEPALKAKFIIRIERPNDYHALSNMPIKSSQELKDVSRTLDVFEETPLMSTYLVAFTVSDFKSLTTANKNFSIWSRPNAIDNAQDSLKIATELLKLMENLFEINYTLPKMDLIAIPDFLIGGLENWGFVSFREEGLLYQDGVTPAGYKRYKNVLIAHELSHMWFGNLVTCDWWNYTWLNEGFAQYLQAVMIDKLIPSWKILKQFTVTDMQVAMSVDSYLVAGSMNNQVLSPSQIVSGFNDIAYVKSASVIRMIHNSFGNKVFFDAIQDYLMKRQFKTATPDHLYDSLQSQVDENILEEMNVTIKDIMNSWVNQSGYPVVNVTLINGTMLLSQERYLLLEHSTFDQIYWIPITYVRQSEPNFENTMPNFWFGNKSMTVNVNNTDEWLILNVQRVGYYRVNYDTDSWYRLINILQSNNFRQIHDVNRAQIVEDVLNLARAGYVPYTLALNVTEYLINEDNYLPWKSLFNEFLYLSKRFQGQKINDLFGKHIRTIVQNIYRKLGFQDRKGDNLMDEIHRELITKWACKYQYPDCVEKSKNLFSAWRNNSLKPISPNVRSTVYCTALRYGTYEDWLFLWNEYLRSNFASEKLIILEYLGCTENTTTLLSYLQFAISSKEIRRKDINLVFESVSNAGKIGVDASLQFLMNNYNALYSYFGSWENVADLFWDIAGFMSTIEQVNEFEMFIKNNSANLINITNELQNSLKNVKNNLQWFETHSPEIYEFLEKSYTTTTTIGTSLSSTTEIGTTQAVNVTLPEVTTPKDQETSTSSSEDKKSNFSIVYYIIAAIAILALLAVVIFKLCC